MQRAAKKQARAEFRVRRRDLVAAQSQAEREHEGRRIADHAVAYLRGRGTLSGMVVTAFEHMPTEPRTDLLIDTLRTAGVRVLVPITRPDRLDWSDGTTTLGPEVLGTADVAFIPAAAVARDGTRLGHGKAYYDRALPLLTAGTPTIAIVHEAEVVDTLPREDHDVAVWGVLTAAVGVRPLVPRAAGAPE